MSDSILEKVFQFFDSYIDPSRPLLLGLSGGSDSICLLHLLIDYQKTKPLDLHLVHVDHGWRAESATECEKICQLACTLNLPFHTTRLTPEKYKTNLEAESRDERLEFFSQIATKIAAQGILLAHQLEDQLETVFKRFLEGSNLAYLCGMQSITKIGSLTIFRPLLSVQKSEITQFLQKREISFFEDPSNKNPKFLRAKMREEIFPYLRTSFGKEFQESVLHISQEARQMRAYFDEKVNPYFAACIPSDLGVLFDFSATFPATDIERRALFRRLGEMYSFSFNRRQVELALTLIESNAANKWLLVDGKRLYFDRKRLFILEKEESFLHESVPLQIGEYAFGPWSVKVEEQRVAGIKKNHWLDLWKGDCVTFLPKGDYFLRMPLGQMKAKHAFQGKIMERALSEKKVPHILWNSCPFIFQGAEVVEDFLLKYNKNLTSDSLLYISLKK